MSTLPPMTDTDRQRVSDAVTAAEAHTAGEIVTIITEQSSSYADAALVWCSFIAFCALSALSIWPDFYLGLYDRVTGSWAQQWHARELFGLALLVSFIKFLGMWLLQLWQPLRLFLVPGPLKHARVRARAITCFKVGAERRTSGRTGVLIYLSLKERRAEIVADQAIDSKVSADVWGAAMAAMISHIRDGNIAEGMAAGVEQVGQVLAEHFPRDAADINELPDRLIEV